jgi:NAD(P)-dependent dehydrogenase (short-subunit alcohol dehydrogenase family)
LNRIDPMTTTILITGTNRGHRTGTGQTGAGEGVDGLWIGARRSHRSGRAYLPSSELPRSPVRRHRPFGNAGGGGRAIDAPIDILINNAGIIGPERQSTLDMDFDGFAKTLAVNTLAPLAVSQAFLPHLKRSSSPRILTVSSWMGSLSMPSPTGSPTGRRKQRSTR